jgi:hypothetical protein
VHPYVLAPQESYFFASVMLLDFTQSWGIAQVFCGSQDHVRVIIKAT